MKELVSFLFIITVVFAKAQVPVPPETDPYYMLSPEAPAMAEPGNGMRIFKEGDFFGVKRNSEIILAPVYDKIASNNNYFFVTKRAKQGIVSQNGNKILEVKYDSIVARMPFFVSYIGDKAEVYYVVYNRGNLEKEIVLLTEQKLASLAFSNSNFLVFEKNNGKQFVVNRKGRTIENTYEKLILLNEVPVVEKEGRFAFLPENEQNELLYYDEIQRNTKEKLSQSSMPRNATGKVYFTSFSSSRYIVRRDDKWGIVDGTGKLVLDIEYDRIQPEYNKNYFFIHQNRKVGIFEKGLQLPVEFQSIQKSEDYLIAKKDTTYHIYKEQSFQKLPFDSESFIDVSNNEFIIQKHGMFGLVDAAGNTLIPFEFDKIDKKSSWDKDFPEDHYRIIARKDSEELQGVYDFTKQQLIIPIENDFVACENNAYYFTRKGMKIICYDLNGKVLLDLGATYVENSPFRGSNLQIHRKITDEKNPNTDELFLIDESNANLLEKDLISYEMIYDERMLYNPIGTTVSAIQHKNGKFALFDEALQKRVTDFKYDEIYQRTSNGMDLFVVRKGKKYGVVNSRDSVIIPLKYKALELYSSYASALEEVYFVAQKNQKYGVINALDSIVIPFEYKYLESVSERNLFKGKKKKGYQLINLKNQVLNPAFFDEISHFEFNGDLIEKDDGFFDRQASRTPQHQAMTFQDGTMRMIAANGVFTGEEATFYFQEGYSTFDELKFALVKALDSDDERELRAFCQKIAPSSQTLYWFRESMSSKQELFYDYAGRTDQIAEKYFQLLLKFKLSMWNSEYYNQNTLRRVKDFTLYSDGVVTVKRNTDWAYDDTRLMEKVLRNSIKVNGIWISTFFTRSNFDNFR